MTERSVGTGMPSPLSRPGRGRRAVLSGVAAAALLLPPVLLLTPPAPAWAADVYVELNPSTVEAGYLVGIRASCRENTEPATVESDAFADKVTVEPQLDLLTAAATVPEDRSARPYRVKLTCPDGRVATAVLNVVQPGRPSEGPATGFGGTAGDNPGSLLLGAGLATVAAGVALGVFTSRRQRA
ncbi:hypothetical protein AB0M79_17350 [Polymorphospora sp. NPDC051019]|uniref:hypothetical protein n=1 Tax=unclassified Polymorphospora TaxID=2685497 RepID=UPI0033EA456A